MTNHIDQGRKARADGKTLADNPYGRLMTPQASHDWCKGWAEEDAHRAADSADLDNIAPTTYAAPRALVQEWADDGDASAASWLSDCLAASFFGIDDGGIQTWFLDQEHAEAWVAECLADSAEQRAQ